VTRWGRMGDHSNEGTHGWPSRCGTRPAYESAPRLRRPHPRARLPRVWSKRTLRLHTRRRRIELTAPVLGAILSVVGCVLLAQRSGP
jgi:hypothetical protein